MSRMAKLFDALDGPATSIVSLRSLAWMCKVMAIFISAVVPLLIFRPRWGVNRIADAQIVCMAVLSLIPNRWLVFSRISFVIFLLLALFPFRIFFDISAYRNLDLPSVIAIFIDLFFLAPLPLSLVLSRMRFQRGAKFIYA
jgi:hypothetical protein